MPQFSAPQLSALRALSFANFALCLLVAFTSPAQAQTASTDPSVIALDNLFKSLPANQKSVTIRDMTFRIETLKAWRDYLASHSGGFSAQGAFDYSHNTKWTNARVPFSFDSGVTSTYQTLFKQGLFEWQKVANVAWVPSLSSDTNKVKVMWNGSAGMNSSVGMVGNGQQIINIDTSSSIFRCAHEAGHCMGFVHEQVRSDRDTYVTVTSTSPGVDALTSVNWAKLPAASNTLATTYDYDSVMHYPASGCAGDPQACATITPKDPYYTNAGKPTLGQETHISTLDAAALVSAYHPPCQISGRITSGGVGVYNATLTIAATGNSAYYGPTTIQTDDSGNFTFPGTATGTYTVTPSGGPGGPYSPGNYAVTIGTTSATNLNYTMTDTTVPTQQILTPDSAGHTTALPSVTGVARDGVGVDYIREAIKDNATGKWWVWSSSTWGSTTFSVASNDKPIDNSTNTKSFYWTASLPDPGSGDFTFSTDAVDVSANVSTAQTITYIIDRNGPVVTVTTPINKSAVNSLTSIGGTVTDASPLKTSQVGFTLNHNNQYWDGSAWGSTQATIFANVTGTTWSSTLVPKGTNFTPGIYYISAFSTDTLDNLSTATPNVNQTQFSGDSGPPTVSVTSLTAGANFTAGPTSFSGLAHDDTGITSVDLDIRRESDGKWWDLNHWGDGSATLPVTYPTANQSWASNGGLPSGTSSATGWVSGAYTVRATAHDGAGNSMLAEVPFTITNAYTWTGATIHDSDPDHGDNSYDNASNWSPNGVPGSADTAIISNGDTVLMTGGHSVLGLTISGGSQVTTSTATTIYTIKTLNMGTGQINGGVLNSNGGVWNWTDGTLTGTINLASGATLNLSGSATKSFGDASTFNNSGTVNWTGPGSFYCYGANSGGATFNSKAGSTFNLLTDGNPFSTSTSSTFNLAAASGSLAAAQFIKTGGTGSTELNSWLFNMSAPLTSNTGTLSYNCTINMATGTGFNGSGKHALIGGTLNIAGTVTANATTFNQSGGTLNAANTGASFVSSSSDTWNWTDGIIQGVLNNAGTMNLSGAATKNIGDASTFNNTGTVNWSGGAIYCYGANSGGSIINNLSGANFNASGATNFTTSTSSTFNNKSGGTLTRSGTGATQTDWFFNNDGTVKNTAGTFIFNNEGKGSGVLNAANTTLFQFASGVQTLTTPKFQGSGHYQLTGGTVTLNGNLTLGDTSTPGTLEVLSGTLNGISTIGSGSATSSALNWQGGSIGGTQTWSDTLQVFISDPGTSAVIKSFEDATTINNDGLVTWTGSGPLYCYGANSGGTTFNNRSGASFTFANAGTPFTTSTSSLFNNQSGAKFIKNATGTLTLSGWNFTNASEIQTNGGTTEFLSTLDINTGSKFTGAAITRFAGTTNANVPFSATGTIALDGGRFNGVSNFAFTGPTFNWTDGTIAGQFTINTGCAFTMSGAATKNIDDATVINNKATMKWSGGPIYTYGANSGGSTINNMSGATFDIAAAGTPFTTSTSSTFNNLAGGKLLKSVSNGVVTLGGWTFNTASEINAATGTVLFANTVNINSGAKFTGDGVVQFAGLTNVNAPFSSVGTMQLTDGTLTSVSTASYTGILSWLNGTITGQLTVPSGSVMNVSGAATKTLADAAVLNNSGTITWGGGGSIDCYGANSGPAIINNLSGGTFNVSVDGTPFSTSSAATFNNLSGAHFVKTAGTASTTISGWTYNSGTWDGSHLVAGGETKANTGTLEFNAPLNLNGGTFDGAGQHLWSGGLITARATFTVDTSKVTFSGGTLDGEAAKTLATGTVATTGAATFNWAGGTISGTLAIAPACAFNINGAAQKTLADAAVINNSGTVVWSAGDIYCYGGNGPATFNNLTTGAFNPRGTGALTTSSTANFKNAGYIDVATSTMNSNWNLTQTSTGTIRTTLSSNTVYGSIKGSGNVALAGTLNANVQGSYIPGASALFKVLTHGTRTGTFSKVTTNLTSRYFTATYNPNDVTIGASTFNLSVNDVAVTEGNTGSTSATFTVSLSAPCTLPVSVNYATADGTAIATKDYAATSGTLNFAAGEVKKTLVVPVLGDVLDEPNETYLVKLSSPVNALVTKASGTGTINDDDAAPSISVDDPSMTEGDTGTAPLTFTVKLSAPSGNTVKVKYATSNAAVSPAKAGTDYTAIASTTLSFAPGETSKTVVVNVIGDTLNEPTENVGLTLSSPSLATISDATGVGAILDNDGPPSASINDISLTEGNTGSVNATFTVTLSASSGNTITMNYATADITATAGTDYTAKTGTLTFAPGVTSQTILVAIKVDILDETDEQFKVVLSAPTNVTLAKPEGIATIKDDDATPSISVANASVTEGNTGTVPLNFTVKLSAASGQPVTVSYQTADDATTPATAGVDYTAVAATTLTFAPGETSKTVPVTVKGDTLDEDNELLDLVLSSPTNATVSTAKAIGTITDDDATPSLKISDVTVAEGNTGSTTANLTVTLSAVSGRPVTVKFATADVTAKSTSDYTAQTGTLTFAPGETTKTISIAVTGDTVVEPNETLNVVLSTPVAATIADTTGVVTITNDDVAAISQPSAVSSDSAAASSPAAVSDPSPSAGKS